MSSPMQKKSAPWCRPLRRCNLPFDAKRVGFLRKFATFTALFAAFCLAVGCASKTPPAIPMYFFHDTACASCDGAEEFLTVFDAALGDEKQKHPYILEIYNTFTTDGNEKYHQILADADITPADAAPPVLIVNGTALCGMEAIQKNLLEHFLSAAQTAATPAAQRCLVEKADAENLFADIEPNATDSVAVYFYRITCDECNETEPVLDALPQTLTIDGKKSPVTLYPLNTRVGSNRERIAAMFRAYHVPEKDQMVPIVFLREGYLAGYAEISAHLQQRLQNGDGLRFVFPA